MNLQKLISLREGHRRIIAIQIEKLNGDLSQGDAAELIQVITQKSEIIKGLNEKIINHPETEDIATELVESEEYSINLDLQIRNLGVSRNSTTPPTTDLTEAHSERQTSNNATSGMEEHTSGYSDDSISTGRNGSAQALFTIKYGHRLDVLLVIRSALTQLQRLRCRDHISTIQRKTIVNSGRSHNGHNSLELNPKVL